MHFPTHTTHLLSGRMIEWLHPCHAAHCQFQHEGTESNPAFADDPWTGKGTRHEPLRMPLIRHIYSLHTALSCADFILGASNPSAVNQKKASEIENLLLLRQRYSYSYQYPFPTIQTYVSHNDFQTRCASYRCSCCYYYSHGWHPPSLKQRYL